MSAASAVAAGALAGAAVVMRGAALRLSAHAARRYIDSEILGLGWIAQPRISAALIGDGKRQCCASSGSATVGRLRRSTPIPAEELIGFVLGGREQRRSAADLAQVLHSYPECMLIEVVAW